MIKAEAKALGDIGLHLVHFSAEFLDGLAGLGSGEFGWGAVLISGTEKHNFVASGTLEPGIEISRELTSNQISKVFDPIDIGNCRSNQNACHAIHP